MIVAKSDNLSEALTILELVFYGYAENVCWNLGFYTLYNTDIS